MQKRKNLSALSANTVQVILNQVSGLAIFYFITMNLPKIDYGEISWSLAVISSVIAIAGLGMEQVVVKKIAAEGDVKKAGNVFFFHTCLTGGILLFFLFVFQNIFPEFKEKHLYLSGISVSVILTFFSNPFKQIAIAKEEFPALALMQTAGASIKALLLLYVSVFSHLSAVTVVIIFVVASLVELLLSVMIIYFFLGIKVRPLTNAKTYFEIVKESLPQFGSQIFDSALARVDWILLGFLAGSIATAEYSFAYKAFEISRLPLLIISPVLLVKFSKYFGAENKDHHRNRQLDLLLRIESFIAPLTPMILSIMWVPIAEIISGGKYGGSNEGIFLILVFSAPLHYFVNFLWTLAFTQNQTRLVFRITTAIAVINILLNLVLIKFLKAEGSAIAFTVCTIAQLIFYKIFVRSDKFRFSLKPALFMVIAAAVLVLFSRITNFNSMIKVSFSIVVYCFLSFYFGVIKKDDFKELKTIFLK